MHLAKIKEEAIKLFGTKGYEGTSMKDITKTLGITAPAIYAHYKSKEELFLGVLSECYDLLVNGADNTIEKHMKEGEYEVLYNIYRYYLGFYMEHTSKSMFLIRNMIFPPLELKKKAIEMFYLKTSDISGKVTNIFLSCRNKGLLKEKSGEQYLDTFYKLINSFLFKITALEQPINEAEIEEDWNNYWSNIKR